MTIRVNLLGSEPRPFDFDIFMEQLSEDYSGRRSSRLLWEWSDQDATQFRWHTDAINTWSELIKNENEIPNKLIQHALFDHPSNDVYISALKKSDATSLLHRQLTQVLSCCEQCTTDDRSYRFGQWINLLDDSSESESFKAGVYYFNNCWSRNDRRGLEQQLTVMSRTDEVYNSIDETVDTAISLMHALCALAEFPINETPPWLKPLNELHRSLAHLITLHLKAESDVDNKIYLTQRQQGLETLNNVAPELINQLSQTLQNYGVQDSAQLLLKALEKIQLAVNDQADKTPHNVINGIQQSLWATKSTDYEISWSYESPVVKEMVS
ncbi:MAG: hypothetical protein HRU15_02260 [Planctomycetes bacterium]|nr:hypothetical protein [Planctomycetota bacterium]